MNTSKLKIVNLTPHVVRVSDKSGSVTEYPASGVVARVNENSKEVGKIGGVPLCSISYGDLAGLPKPKDLTLYIVSKVVFDAAIERDDLVYPASGMDGVIRHNGQIHAVPALVCKLSTLDVAELRLKFCKEFHDEFISSIPDMKNENVLRKFFDFNKNVRSVLSTESPTFSEAIGWRVSATLIDNNDGWEFLPIAYEWTRISDGAKEFDVRMSLMAEIASVDKLKKESKATIKNNTFISNLLSDIRKLLVTR